MTQKEIYIQEIRRLKQARDKTASGYLKRDYDKAIKRKKKELAIYEFNQRRNKNANLQTS